MSPRRQTRGVFTASDLERHENARTAVLEARKFKNGWEAAARMMSRNSKMKVELTAGATSCTDGKTIYIRVPPDLADMPPHRRAYCGKRDEDSVLICPACSVLEDVQITVIHEICHVIFETFEEVSPYEQMKLLENALNFSGDGSPEGSRAAKIKRNIENAPDDMKRDYLNLGNLVSPFLPILINACEDIRVNTLMQKERPGTRVMFNAQTSKVFRDGVKDYDGSIKHWDKAPPNAQAMIGVYCKAGGFNYRNAVSPEVAEKLDDPELDAICAKMADSSSVRQVYKLSMPLLETLRRLGFCKIPDEPEDDPEEEQPEDSASEDEGDQSPGGEGEDEAPPQPPTMPEDNDEAGSPGDSEDSGEGSDDEEESSDSGGDNDDSEESSDQSSGADSGEDNDTDGASEPDGEEDDGGTGQGQAGDDGESDPGDDQESNEDNADSPDAGPESVPPEGQEEVDGDGGSSDDEEGSDSDDQDEGDSSGSPDSGDQGEESEPSDAGQEDGDDGESQAESDDSPDGGDSTSQDSGSDAGDEESSNASDSDTGEGTSDADDSGDPSDGNDTSEETSEGSTTGDTETDTGVESPEGADTDTDNPSQDPATSPDSTPTGDEDPSGQDDTGEDDSGQDSADKDNEEDVNSECNRYSDRDLEEDGTPEEVEHLFKVFGRHEKQQATPSGAVEESKVEEAIETALRQVDYFDSPSLNIKGVDEHRFEDGHRAWSERYGGISTLKRVPVSEGILISSLQRMRLAFTDNARGRTERNRRSGKVDAKVLARRAPAEDDRLFKKKTVPGRRDYFVLIGLDISGSTSDNTSYGVRLDLMKAVAAAKAELLHRLGITFAVYAHSGSMGTLDIFEIKNPKEKWGKKQKEALDKLQPFSANLDGHTLEYYRKVAQRRPETDRLILYYTDGAMPAANYHEELEILQREIKMCEKLDIHLVGVGVNSDSPTEHGLDTILLNGVEDIPKVIVELRKRLM